ncbi:unnamed protein product [Closterium sp. Naga37s-1]|nr:unnamed protein product [Closterium sp. Naga37s-1]
MVHSGALNTDRSSVAGGGATAARIANAAGVPVVTANRRSLCDDNATVASDSNEHDSTKNNPSTNASESDGGSNHTSTSTGSDAVRNHRDQGHTSNAAGSGKGTSERVDGEGKGELVGNDANAEKNKDTCHESSRRDGREERNEKDKRKENNEKSDGDESEKKETRGKSDNGNTHEQSHREREEAGNVGTAEKGGNGDEIKTAERSHGGDSSRAGEDHTKCNDSTEGESSTSGSSGSGTDVSLADRLGGSEKLPSSLAALLADALIRLTATAQIQINGQGLDLGRRAGRQGSSSNPISRSGHPARRSDQVLANPLMAVNLYVFNKPIEISAVHSFENKGSVSLQTQLALTTALARDNATHRVASSAALGAASDHRELAEAHELLGDPPKVHAGSSPVHVSRSNRRKLAVVAAVDEETRKGMEAWMQDEVKRAVSRGLKQLRQKLLEDVDKRVRKLQQGSHCGGKKRSGLRGKGGSNCKKSSNMGSGGSSSSQSKERMTGGKHGDEKSHYQGEHGEGGGGEEKHGKVGEVKEIVGEVKNHGLVGGVGAIADDDVSGCTVMSA